MDYKEIYNQWLENPYFDEATKEELKAIKDDENEIKERFYMDLEFGTAGLHRRRYQPYEYLCGKKSDPGACQLYCQG